MCMDVGAWVADHVLINIEEDGKAAGLLLLAHAAVSIDVRGCGLGWGEVGKVTRSSATISPAPQLLAPTQQQLGRLSLPCYRQTAPPCSHQPQPTPGSCTYLGSSLAFRGKDVCQPPSFRVSVSKSKARICAQVERRQVQQGRPSCAWDQPGPPLHLLLSLSMRHPPTACTAAASSHSALEPAAHFAIEAVRPLEGQRCQAAQEDAVLNLIAAGIPALAGWRQGGAARGGRAQGVQEHVWAGGSRGVCAAFRTPSRHARTAPSHQLLPT